MLRNVSVLCSTQIGQVNDKLNILRWVGLQGSIILKQANSLSVPEPNNIEQNSHVPYVNMMERERIDEALNAIALLSDSRHHK